MNLSSGIHIEQTIMQLPSLRVVSAEDLAIIMRHLFTIKDTQYERYIPLNPDVDPTLFTQKVNALTTAPEQRKPHSSLADTSLHKTLAVHVKSLSPELPLTVQLMLTKLKKADINGEISTLSRTFVISLRPEYGHRVPAADLIRLLDTANLFAWCAYSLYDTILDEKTTVVLPYANSCLQASADFYAQAGVPHKLITQLFQYVNRANGLELYERAYFTRRGSKLIIQKIPGLKTQKQLLANKSIVHCLGPLWISRLVHSNVDTDYFSAFQFYCAARQGNDDVHDWRDDLQNAQPTYAIARMLRSSNVTVGSYQLAKLTEILGNSYWDSQLMALSKSIEHMAQASARQLKSLLDEKSPFLERYVAPIAHSAQQARKVHQFNKDFLHYYNSFDK